MLAFVLVIGAAIALDSSAPAATFHPRFTQVTWTGDVAAIVQRRCTGCHVDGGFGPMPLARYQDARNWSRAMSEHAMDGLMPPWPAAAGIGNFSNDRSLSPVEVELLAAWAQGGAIEGPPVSTPQPASANALKKPDFVGELTQPLNDGGAVSRFEVPLALVDERWLTAWEFEPRERARVQRVVLGAANDRISSWVPPEKTIEFPAGVANRLTPHATLTVDVFYRKGARPPEPGGRLSLYYGGEPRHELRHRLLPCGATTLDESIDLLSVEPVTNESGASIEAIAHRPDRSVEPLILISRFLTWYVPAYHYRSAIRLPRGSRVDVQSSAPTCSMALDYVPVR